MMRMLIIVNGVENPFQKTKVAEEVVVLDYVMEK